MDVNSKEADDWAATLRIAEIIHQLIPGVDWPKATTVAADVVTCVLRPKLDAAQEGQMLLAKALRPNPDSLFPGGL